MTDHLESIPLPLDSQTRTSTLPDGDTRVMRSVLACGARVITQDVPATHSVALGLWVPVGSRDETPEQAGSTHFLEHLLFKGTKHRSALDISQAFDAVGGESNAETGKESTDYWARVVDQDMPMALDTLMDMVTDSVLDRQAFEVERNVILGELAMAEDQPTDVVHQAFAQGVYGDTPSGRPVGGTPEIISAVTRDQVWDHYQHHYGPTNLVVAAAGNVSHANLVELVEAALAEHGWSGAGQPRPRRSTIPAEIPVKETAVTRHRDVEQAHVIVGGPSLRALDPRRSTLSVLVSILGGSMSSRLFQEVREKRGLAYSTYAFDSPLSDSGTFGMYAGTTPDQVEQVRAIMVGQLEELAENGPSEEEMVRVRGQMRGGMALGLEDSWSRMARLGSAEVRGEYLPVDRVLGRISQVSAKDVQDLAAMLAAHATVVAQVLPREGK